MAKGKRKHPTESIGVMPEVNTIHAFGANGNETSGWPFQATSRIGTPIAGGTRLYRAPRMTADALGGRGSRRRKKR